MFTFDWLTSLPELTTVNEDDANEDQLREQLQAEIIATDAAAAAAAAEAEAARRTSGNSGMSGTTVKTSFSQEEIGELDPDVMVDLLPSLSTASEDLAKLLVPVDPKSRSVVRKEIRTPGSKFNKLYMNRVTTLSTHKHSFGSTEYIQPSIVLRALLGVQNMRDVPQGLWRPDSVIYKINLAQMLNCVLILLVDNVQITEEGKSAIDNLDVHFPAAIAGPEFKQNAFQLCLSLLTQISIIHVTESMTHPEFDAEKVVMNTFYAPDQDGDMVFRHKNVLHMMHLSEADQSAYSATIQQLVYRLTGTFGSTTDTVAALGALRARYPWEAFVEHVIQYYLEKKLELDEQISAVGGIDQIMLGLAEEVDRRKDARAAEVKRQSFSRPGGTPKKSFGKGGIKALKAREKQLAANAAPPTPAPTATAPVAQMTELSVAPAANPNTNTAVPVYAAVQPELALVPDDDGFNRLEDDDYPIQPTQAQSTARSTLAALTSLQATQRQNAAKGKGRSFIDRQEGATRVNFDESQQLTDYRVPENFQYPASSAPERGPYYQSPRRTAAKRAYEEDEPEEFEPTQDQGFQVDTRDITAAADQRRREAPQSRPVQPRFSGVASTAAPGPSGAQATPTQSPAKRQRKNPGSTIPQPLAPFDPDDDTQIPSDQRFQRAKVAARHGTITARQNKATQVRTPWSDQEESALIDLIEEEGGDGIHYSRLKAFDDGKTEPMLARRSAEDMRFKARNMKETFLK